MSVIRKNINVRYDANANPKFTYKPKLRRDPAGHRVVAKLAGKKGGHVDYVLVFTLTGADWPESGWIEFLNGTPPPFNGHTGVKLNQNQRMVPVKNALGVSSLAVEYGFKLKVIAAGGEDESPDPEIVLDPPRP